MQMCCVNVYLYLISVIESLPANLFFIQLSIKLHILQIARFKFFLHIWSLTKYPGFLGSKFSILKDL